MEIFFSILERKLLRPNIFESLLALEANILSFEERYQAAAKPYDWKYTRHDLALLLALLLARLSSDSAPQGHFRPENTSSNFRTGPL